MAFAPLGGNHRKQTLSSLAPQPGLHNQQAWGLRGLGAGTVPAASGRPGVPPGALWRQNDPQVLKGTGWISWKSCNLGDTSLPERTAP